MDLWAGSFGDDYTRRNSSHDTSEPRRQLWEQILPAGLESILEVGANVGQNLWAISRQCNAELYAAEPNALARAELASLDILPERNITADYADKLSWPDGIADLVITCGLLIHIPPDKLLPSMREIHRCAKRWIISAEYFAPSEEMVPYRGHTDALWRRDYGSLWLDNFPDMRLASYSFAWRRVTGLDNLTIWVMEKNGMH